MLITKPQCFFWKTKGSKKHTESMASCQCGIKVSAGKNWTGLYSCTCSRHFGSIHGTLSPFQIQGLYLWCHPLTITNVLFADKCFFPWRNLMEKNFRVHVEALCRNCDSKILTPALKILFKKQMEVVWEKKRYCLKFIGRRFGRHAQPLCTTAWFLDVWWVVCWKGNTTWNLTLQTGNEYLRMMDRSWERKGLDRIFFFFNYVCMRNFWIFQMMFGCLSAHRRECKHTNSWTCLLFNFLADGDELCWVLISVCLIP